MGVQHQKVLQHAELEAITVQENIKAEEGEAMQHDHDGVFVVAASNM